jgi:hypothetical protein
MNRKFIKYGIVAVVLTYSAVFINMNYGHKHNENIGKVSASAVSISSKDYVPDLIAEGGYFTPCMNSEDNKLLYSSGDDIYQLDLSKNDVTQLTTMGNCYNPVYYEKDNNIIAFARNDGIYKMEISSKKITKVIGTENPQISFAKPNFTPEEDIIYFRITVLPSPDGHGFMEKDPSIYKLTKDGKSEIKLLEGYNPVLSKDGKNLLYELKDNIYVMNMETKESKFVDQGKYAAWSNSGKYVSYAKFDRESKPYTKLSAKRKLFIDREFSNIYLADLSNLKTKTKLTSAEFDNRDEEIESWANDAKDNSGEQHFLVVSKTAFFDTEWSKDDNELYVSVYNSDKSNFELLKYKLKKE